MPASHKSSSPLVIEEAGAGRPVLVLHGGGGPDTVRPITTHLAATHRVLMPTLPGWNGAPRPNEMTTIGDYAQTFLDYLTGAGLTNVVVIGSSLGGWIASEMLTRDSSNMLGAVVIIDGAGITVEDEPIVDFFSLTPREVAEHSWHDADRFFIDPTTFPPARAEMQKQNMATMAEVAAGMNNPALRAQLSQVRTPALVLWGDSDRIFTPSYGRAYAESFARGRFEPVANAGHLPQLEQPAATLALIDEFLQA